MKRKITLILAVLFLLSAVLTACEFRNTKLEGDIAKDAAAHSNGGTAVMYDGYLYFINGVEATEDPEGKNNKWGEIEKGGIYRARFEGSVVDLKVTDPFKLSVEPEVAKLSNGDPVKSFNIPVKDLPLKTSKVMNYDDEELDSINVERVVPKIVTVVNGRGLFIYDGYIYYTTPNNRKDKSGTVQYTYVDFMRTSLDGSKTIRIATSSTADVQYNIYYKDGSTYLVTYENSTLTSFEIGKNRVTKKYKISDAVTGVAFAPNKELWYKTMPTGRLSDYVYYTRANTDADTVKAGNTICMASPDGRSVHRDILTGKEYVLSKIADEILLYQHADPTGNTKLEYTDLAAELSEINGGDIYERDAEAKNSSILTKSGVALYNNIYTSYIAQKASPYDDTITIWAIDSTGVTKFRNGELEGSVTDRILHEQIDVVRFDTNTQIIYYTKSADSGEYRTLYFANANTFRPAGEAAVPAAKSMFYSSFGVDFIGDNMFYIVETIKEWNSVSQYMRTSRLMFADTAEEFFVGQLKEADIPEDEE